MGQSYTLLVQIQVPALTPLRAYEGTIHVREGSRTVPLPLPVTLQVGQASAVQVPRIPSIPSPDRLATDADGTTVVQDELIVILKEGVTDPEAAILRIAQESGGRLMGSSPRLLFYQVAYDVNGLPALQAIRGQLETLEDVAAAVPNQLFPLQASGTFPDDTVYTLFDNWEEPPAGLFNWNLEQVRAPFAWDLQTGSADRARIAVIDGAFDREHPDLIRNLNAGLQQPNSPDVSRLHGTHVAGIACAEGNNRKGIAGVTWNCDLRLYPAGVAIRLPHPLPSLPFDSDEDGIVPVLTALGATYWMDAAAHEGARIVNLSLGAPDALGVNRELYRAAISRIRNRGDDILWIVAAGNDGADARNYMPAGLSAEFDNVLTVGATTSNGNLWWSPQGESGCQNSCSNTGPAVTVAAPGEYIYSTIPVAVKGPDAFLPGSDPPELDAYGVLTGTSMAAPHVAGLAGLVWSQHDDLSASEVATCIVNSTEPQARRVPGHTFGIVDAAAAVKCEPSCEDESVTVSARQWWQDSGIAVNTGDTVTLSTTGVWGDSAGSVGPDGRASQIVTGPCSGISQEDCFPLWGYPIDLLVARVGTHGVPFPAGSSATVTAPSSGTLQFVINDRRDILWDNFGTLTVKARVCR